MFNKELQELLAKRNNIAILTEITGISDRWLRDYRDGNSGEEYEPFLRLLALTLLFPSDHFLKADEQRKPGTVRVILLKLKIPNDVTIFAADRDIVERHLKNTFITIVKTFRSRRSDHASS